MSYRKLLYTAMGILHNMEDAEEIVGDVYLVLLEKGKGTAIRSSSHPPSNIWHMPETHGTSWDAESGMSGKGSVHA